MLGIVLALIVAFLKAGGEFAGKIYTNPDRKNSIHEYTLAFGGRIFGALLILPAIFFIDIHALSPKMALILGTSAMLNGTATVTSLKAFKYGDISMIGPLSAFTIPFLIISGYFIAGESPNIYGLIGVFLIFLGTYFLQISKFKEGVLAPLKAIIESKGARFMLLTAAIWSITTPLDKLGIVEYGVFSWMLYLNVTIAILMVIYSFFWQRQSFKELVNKKALKKITVLTTVGGGTLLLQMFALKLTLAIYVISLKRASGIFSVLLGYFHFKEKHIAQKLVATGIMLVGVFIITYLGNI